MPEALQSPHPALRRSLRNGLMTRRHTHKGCCSPFSRASTRSRSARIPVRRRGARGWSLVDPPVLGHRFKSEVATLRASGLEVGVKKCIGNRRSRMLLRNKHFLGHGASPFPINSHLARLAVQVVERLHLLQARSERRGASARVAIGRHGQCNFWGPHARRNAAPTPYAVTQ